jgi:hypothetical protein
LAIGTLVASLPPSCEAVNYNGVVYRRCGQTWYLPHGSQWEVVPAPY